MALDPGLTVDCSGCGGTGTIEAESGNLLLNDTWISVTDWTSMWIGGAKRGSDRILPGVAGVLPFRRRFTVTTYSLPLLVVGSVRYDGSFVVNDPGLSTYGQYVIARNYLATNIRYLYTEILINPATIEGTRHLTLILPNAEQLDADVHVLAIEPGQRAEGFDARTGYAEVAQQFTLEISVPSGVFESSV